MFGESAPEAAHPRFATPELGAGAAAALRNNTSSVTFGDGHSSGPATNNYAVSPRQTAESVPATRLSL